MVVIWKRINWLGETSSSTVSGRPDSLAYMDWEWFMGSQFTKKWWQFLVPADFGSPEGYQLLPFHCLDATLLGRSIQWQADGIAIVSRTPSCTDQYLSETMHIMFPSTNHQPFPKRHARA
jgi:hypothetical protein